MKIPRIKKSPSKLELLDALKNLTGKWFNIKDMPFEMSKSSFEKRITTMRGEHGQKRMLRGNLQFYISDIDIIDIELNAKYPENKVKPVEQKITPHKLTSEDKMFNLMMGA